MGDITGRAQGRLPVRDGAERYLMLTIASFIVAVVGTRWYLQATGYPQVGGGELHVAHMLWGGLLLVIAALMPLVVAAGWVSNASAILAGAGTGLFIDEVGKFITASNDYFYPLAAPLIYGLLLALVLLFVILRRRPDGAPVVTEPGRMARWEDAHLPRRRYRRLLVSALALFGVGWALSFVIFVALDPATLRDLIQGIASAPGDVVERPTDPLFYWLEVAILGMSGIVLLVAAALVALGRDRSGITLATIGLVVALTAGAIVSLYVEQVSAILSTLLNGGLLFAVVHYGNRFLTRVASVQPNPGNTTTGSQP